MENTPWTIWEAVGIGVLSGLIATGLAMAFTYNPQIYKLLPTGVIIQFYLVIVGVELIFSIAGALVGKYLGKTWLITIVIGSIVGPLLPYCLFIVFFLVFALLSGMSY